MAYDVNHLLTVGDAKTIHDSLKSASDDLADAFEDLITLEPIEQKTYYPVQMGGCFQNGVSIDDMVASDKVATIPQRLDASIVLTLYWDNSVYTLSLVPLNNDGTGKGNFYDVSSYPYTTTPVANAIRTFMIRRKDGAVIGNVDLNRLVYTQTSESNPIVDATNSVKNELLGTMSESDDRIESECWQGFVKYDFPSDFTWSDNPVAGLVSTDGKGKFRVDYNVMDHISTDGLDVYMAATGSDTNDGLSADKPKLSLSAAIGITNARRVHIAGGYYPRIDISTLSNDIDLIGDPDDRPIFTGQTSTIEWTATETTGIYTTPHKSNIKCYDLTTITGGMFRLYTEAESAADMQANEGTFYDDGTTFTIHTFDDVEPTVANTCYAQGWPAMNIGLNGHSVLAANLCFICSGTYSSKGQVMLTGDNTYRGTFFLYNCDSSYSIRPDADHMSGGSAFNPGTADGIIQYCTSYYSGNDGFSYGSGINVVEIGCASAYNGNEVLTSSNGSTGHGGSIIRINCAYHDTHGPIVHDVGATESVNLGIAAWHSTCEGAPNFCASDGAAKMWLDSCVSYSSDAGINVGKDGDPAPYAAVYKRNCTSDVADGEYGGHIYRY